MQIIDECRLPLLLILFRFFHFQLLRREEFRLGSVGKRNPEEQAVIPPVDLFSHVNEAVLFALALRLLCLPQMYTTILSWHKFTSLGSDNLNSRMARHLVEFLYYKYYYKANYVGNEVVIESKPQRFPKTQRKNEPCHALRHSSSTSDYLGTIHPNWSQLFPKPYIHPP